MYIPTEAVIETAALRERRPPAAARIRIIDAY